MTTAAVALADDTPTFPLFSLSPLEIRDMVWREAVLEGVEVEPAIYFYNGGCWQPRYLTPTDDDYDPRSKEMNLEFAFRNELLNAVHNNIPLFSVNREARRNVLTWVRKQNLIEVHPSNGQYPPVFACKFNSNRDVLYVPLDRWDGFWCEAIERGFQPDMKGRFFFSRGSDITRLALPTELSRDNVADLLAETLREHFRLLQELILVSNSPPDLEYVDPKELEMQRRRELNHHEGELLIGDELDHRFKVANNKDHYDGAAEELCHRLFGTENQGLVEVLKNESTSSFKVRHVIAVRR